MENPCAEIVLDEKHPVAPWYQIALMNYFRVQSGKEPYTPQEIQALELQLMECRSCHQKWNDSPKTGKPCELCGRLTNG